MGKDHKDKKRKHSHKHDTCVALRNGRLGSSPPDAAHTQHRSKKKRRHHSSDDDSSSSDTSSSSDSIERKRAKAEKLVREAAQRCAHWQAPFMAVLLTPFRDNRPRS